MKKKNYISNKQLYLVMQEYYNKVNQVESTNARKPPIPNYVGESITLICNNLAKKPNFSGYTYKTEMIGDAIVDCVAAVDNFNPNKTNNPFAYFTQIAWNAFIRRLHKEKKQTYIKHKNYQNVLLGDVWNEIRAPKNDEISNEIIRNFETTMSKAKKQTKTYGVEKFVEGNNNE